MAVFLSLAGPERSSSTPQASGPEGTRQPMRARKRSSESM